MRALGFVKRNSRGFTQASALVTLYKTLVQLILEYASVMWSPSYNCHTQQIERVFRAFLRFLAHKLSIPHENIDYHELARRFNLLFPHNRRSCSDVSFLHGLLSGRIDAPDLLARVGFLVPRLTSRSATPFAVPFSSTNYLYNRPMCHIPRLVNFFSTSPPFIDIVKGILLYTFLN
ncbi:hypothetical protein GE061_000775 [Apolygus lucorum]|uniref:Uncharacterized protein n=1 Tax=Apolygus lucorum TaxID=248454 RepID=A0A8S9Y5I1_APOLU|nr:hypothetical protein GE061_000775 [Apolygus lucorum]